MPKMKLPFFEKNLAQMSKHGILDYEVNLKLFMAMLKEVMDYRVTAQQLVIPITV